MIQINQLNLKYQKLQHLLHHHLLHLLLFRQHLLQYLLNLLVLKELLK
jgi:hypothetical protein